MKYSIKDYARALAEASAGDRSEAEKESIQKNFLALVRRNGASSRMGKIVEEAARLLREKEGLRKVSFESARPLSPELKTSLKGIVREKDIVEEKIDPSLVAGIRVVVNDERQFDASFNRKLHQMFSK